MAYLERRALLGDRQAQEECTRRGIVLACPFCGGNSEIHEAEAIAEYAKKKGDVPSGARILRKIVYPSRSECYIFRRKTFVPRCCKTSCVGRTSRQYKTIEEALAKWNARPAHPVGRCRDCAHWYKGHCASPGPCAAEETDADFYCPNFEPKEGEENG